MSTSRLSPTIVLPDLISYCVLDLHTDRNHKLVSVESERWLFNGYPELDGAARRAYRGIKAGKLVSMCYPNVGYHQLRVCSDFSHFLFHLDNLSDDMDDRSIQNVANLVMNSIHHPYTYQSPARLNRMTKDFYKRIRQTATPGISRRFQETMEFYFQAVQDQAIHHANGIVPDVESYIALRRDTSGCRSSFVLIEYAYHLNIPDAVINHPIMRSLEDATNDFVSWSNDIYSYDVEQSKGQTHNMVDVVMQEQGLCLQDAIDVVGESCKRALDRFAWDRASLPSWGPGVDADVGVYVEGLANWIVGSLYWTFESERYFGKAAKQIKATGLVTLRPKRIIRAGAQEA